MASDVFKLIILIKRKPGLSIAEFRDYYEQHHRKIGEAAAPAVGMFHYSRRFLDPVAGGEPEYDVITENWFNDREKFEGLLSALKKGDLDPEVYADEERFIDRSKTRFCTVVECESRL